MQGLYEAHTHRDTNDWRGDPRRSAGRLYDEFAGYDWTGGLALYHDGGGRRPTPDAVPGMIELAIARGYSFHTATELVNSGVPRPVSGTYANLQVARDSLIEDHDDATEAEFMDACNYDVEGELSRRREETTNPSERKRIDEALDEIYQHKRTA